MCRSVHAEANAIIAAARDQMLGAVLYLCCTDPVSGGVMPGTNSCMMCKKLIINSGISKVVIRDTPDDYRIVEVSEWINDDDSLGGRTGY